MARVLIDTVELLNLLANPAYNVLRDAIDDGKIETMVSAISLTELYKVLGKKSETTASTVIEKIIASPIAVIDVDYRVAVEAGKLHLRHEVPTADALIAATALIHNATHILTRDKHFQTLKELIEVVEFETLQARILNHA